jgi:plastocyanin
MRSTALTLCWLFVSFPAWTAPAGAAPNWSKAKIVTVVMVDDRFEPDSVIFHAGQPTTLRLVNQGKEMHEFTAPDFLHDATVPDKRALSNNGGDIVVQPKQTVQVRLMPNHAGHYKLICADHDWDGMVGSITVLP